MHVQLSVTLRFAAFSDLGTAPIDAKCLYRNLEPAPARAALPQNVRGAQFTRRSRIGGKISCTS
jgi:hypothetical protein